MSDPMRETGTWRTKLELSVMSNNDEYVLYTKYEITDSCIPHVPNPRHLMPPKLVFSRPVFQCEIDSGLELVDGQEPIIINRTPRPTALLDDIWQLRVQGEFWIKQVGQSVPDFVLQQVAYQYCDCMSGGMGKYALSFARYVIQYFEVPAEKEIYPNTTVEKFLRETEDVPDFAELFPSKLLPKPTEMLGISEKKD